MENKVIDTIMNRRSIRAYKDEQITEEQLKILCDTALISPTAKNLQTWHYTVIQNKELLDELEKDIVDVLMANGDDAFKELLKSRNYKVIYNAPTLFVLSAEKSAYSDIDAGIAVQSISIAAKSLGLESIILGMIAPVFEGPKADYWKEKLQFPPNHKITISIAIGYGNMEGKNREIDNPKLTLIK